MLGAGHRSAGALVSYLMPVECCSLDYVQQGRRAGWGRGCAEVTFSLFSLRVEYGLG